MGEKVCMILKTAKRGTQREIGCGGNNSLAGRGTT
jgi:hypothetical protein